MRALILISIIIFLYGCYGVTPQKTDKRGKLMPEFSFLLTDSTTWLNTQNIPLGKPVVIIYYSPYCPYCKALTKEITEEMEELKDIQFYFLSPFPMHTIKEFSKVFQLAKYPNIITGLDTSRIVKEYYDAPGIPYMAIYNKNKKLNQAFLGKLSANQIKNVSQE